jgi:transcriptional regulator with XRE-family HTH domain
MLELRYFATGAGAEMKKTKKAGPAGVSADAFLASQLQDPEFRHHFFQRRLAHEVAIAVRSMRASAGLTQAELAKRIGSSQPAIARLEKGLDRRTPQFDTLQRIAAALGRQLKLVFQPEAASAEGIVEVRGISSRRKRSTPQGRGAARPATAHASG